MKLSKRYRGYAVVASALAVSACADNSTAPKSMISSIGNRSANSLNSSALHSNDTQYRPQTMPYQSNRSGSATLTSRALLSKNGSTELTVTSGKVNAQGAAGSISKLQEKFLTGNKEVFATQNFNGLTGPVQTRTFNGLQRHTYIQTQGNVGGIDPKRTDVVTIMERVNLRPDLAVVSVTAPDRSKPGQHFIVNANVKELNGDVGAYDNCVLYIDGSEAGRVNHQWVADGDMVTCAFEASIATAGSHTLEVRSESVNPGDWDTSNNSDSRPIEIVNPEIVLHGSMNAWDYSYRYIYYNDNTYTGTDGRDYRYFSDNKTIQRSSQTYFYAYGDDQNGWENVSAIDLTISSGGSEVAAIHADNLNAGQCTYVNNGAAWLYTCLNAGYYGTYANGGSYGTSAIYYSYAFGHDNWECIYYGNCYDNSWSYGPYGSSSAGGSGTFSGNDATMSLRVEGSAGTVLLGNASVSLDQWYSYWYNNDQPLQCEDGQGWWGSWHNCYEYHYNQSQRYGWTSF